MVTSNTKNDLFYYLSLFRDFFFFLTNQNDVYTSHFERSKIKYSQNSEFDSHMFEIKDLRLRGATIN